MQIRYEFNTLNYNDIPSCPIVYWISSNVINDFKRGVKLGDIA